MRVCDIREVPCVTNLTGADLSKPLLHMNSESSPCTLRLKSPSPDLHLAEAFAEFPTSHSNPKCVGWKNQFLVYCPNQPLPTIHYLHRCRNLGTHCRLEFLTGWINDFWKLRLALNLPPWPVGILGEGHGEAWREGDTGDPGFLTESSSESTTGSFAKFWFLLAWLWNAMRHLGLGNASSFDDQASGVPTA